MRTAQITLDQSDDGDRLCACMQRIICYVFCIVVPFVFFFGIQYLYVYVVNSIYAVLAAAVVVDVVRFSLLCVLVCT